MKAIFLFLVFISSCGAENDATKDDIINPEDEEVLRVCDLPEGIYDIVSFIKEEGCNEEFSAFVTIRGETGCRASPIDPTLLCEGRFTFRDCLPGTWVGILAWTQDASKMEGRIGGHNPETSCNSLFIISLKRR